MGIKRQLPQAGTLLLQAVWRELVGHRRQQQGCFSGVPNRPHRTLAALQVGIGAEAGAPQQGTQVLLPGGRKPGGFHRHAIAGERAGLIAADHTHRAEGFHRR